MSELTTPSKAIEWLEEQLDVLGQLRNATTRDSSFRQWRQAMLTVIQRIWPGDEERSSRLRGVSFTAPVANAGDRAAREHYDRGCTETRRFLRMWIAEIRKNGLQAVDVSDEPSEYEPPELSEPLTLDDSDSDGEDELEDYDLDLTLADAGGEIPEAPRPRVVDLPSIPPTVVGSRGGAEAKAPATPTVASGFAAPRRRTERPRPKGRLKDMLGLSDEEVASGLRSDPPAARERSRKPPVLGSGIAPRIAAVPADARARTAAQATAVPPVPPPRIAVVPAGAKPRATEPAAAAAAATPRSAADDLEKSIFEALERARADVVPTRTTPQRTTLPARVAKPGSSEADTFQSPAAHAMAGELDSVRILAVIALAAEIDHLGVPEGDRGLVQLVLSNLARQLEAGSVTWSTLQEAVAIVMIHPALARRALPVLLQFLDAAA